MTPADGASRGARPALERYARNLWYGNRPPPVLLRLASLAYGAWVRRRPGRPAARPPCPVVVVGNLTAGGSGKTPVVAALVRALRGAGVETAILSRGYGGAEPARPVRVEADTGLGLAGDEALWLARTTQAPVWICRRRDRALEAARRAGAEAVVSDDGLQHAALPRSLEICVIDGARRFGNGRLLPAGPLREPPERLATVDFRLVKIGPGAGPVAPGELAFELAPVALICLADGARLAPVALAPGPVDALAGIADPEGFFRQLEALGYTLRRHPRPDHAGLDPGALEALEGPVILTEKDAVRLEPGRQVPGIHALAVEARLPETLVAAVVEHVREFGR